MNRTSLALLLAALCTATPSFADEAAVRKEAEARFAEGSQLHNAGKEEEARLKFEQAYALAKAPRIVFSLARTEQLTGKPLEALRHFREFMRDPRAPSEFLVKAQGFVGELEKQTARLEIKVPTGALVAVDTESPHVPTGEPVDVLPGKHKVVASLGEKKASKDVDVAATARQTVELAFESSTPPAISSGSVDINPPPPPPGQTDQVPDERVVWTAGRIVITASLAVVGGVAIALGASAAGAHSDAASQIDADNAKLGAGSNACAGGGAGNPICADLSDAYSKRDSAATRETAFFIVGAVALAGAVGTAVAWYVAPVQPTKSTYLTPTATRTGMGLSFGGSF
jgi:hypothetical protein